MRKQTVICAVALTLLLTGCGAKKHIDVDSLTSLPDNAAEATVPAAEKEPARPIAERIQSMQAAEDTHIFDEQNVLTDEERAQYNTYLGWLADIRQICTAAVITNRLDGEPPEAFAREYYHSLFGEGTSGFLVLVNNDTGEDQIYCEGVCETYIAGAPLQIAQATPLLVEGDYAGALDLLLPAGELVPDRVLDRAGALTSEEAQTLMERANSAEKRYCVLFVGETDAAPVSTETAEVTEDTTESESDEAATAEEVTETAAETESAAAPEDAAATEETAAAAPEDTASPLSEDFKTRAGELREKNEAEQLLVIDVSQGWAWIAGGDAALSGEVQTILQQDGAFAAAQHYYDALLGA